MKKLPIVRWFDDLKSALSIYIAGNVAPTGGVTAGKFYFWKSKLRLPTSNISAGETLTESNMPVVPEGGLNKLTIKYKLSYLTNVTIGNYGYLNVTSYKPSGMPNFLFCVIDSITGAMQPVGILADGAYLYGTPNTTFQSLTIKYFYTD